MDCAQAAQRLGNELEGGADGRTDSQWTTRVQIEVRWELGCVRPLSANQVKLGGTTEWKSHAGVPIVTMDSWIVLSSHVPASDRSRELLVLQEG